MRFIITSAIAFLLCASSRAQDAATLAAREANQHAFELFQLFRQMTKGNFCFSPYSGHRVAAMLAEGAKGETQEQIMAMAHLSSDQKVRVVQSAALSKELSNSIGQGLSIDVANAIWMPAGNAFLPSFESMAKDQFGAASLLLPAGAPASSASMVNHWIREKTRGRITSLVGPGTFLPDHETALVVNTVYLKGVWDQPFEPAKTKPREFTQGSGSMSMLPMMLKTAMFGFSDSEFWQHLEMSFAGDACCMRFLLPRADGGRSGIEAALNVTLWDQVRRGEGLCEVNVMLPRFGFSTQLDMKGLWQVLGVRDAFERQKSDLTAMIAKKPCWISQVLHEATIEINEIGAVAAAATAAADPFGAPANEPPKPRRESFIANHPFLWTIEHRRTGLILFMGRFAGE
jgi:serpin B